MKNVQASAKAITATAAPGVSDDLPSRYLALIAAVAGRLIAADDPAYMVDDLFALIRRELRLDVFFNYRLEDCRLLLETHGGLTDAEAQVCAELDLGQAICGCVARNRVAVHVTAVQASDDPRVELVKSMGLDAYACTPLLHGGELIGTLSFGRRGLDRFTDDELNFLHTICHYVAWAKHRLRVERQLRDGVALRDRLLSELNHRVRNALQLAISLMLVDLGDTEEQARKALKTASDRLQVLAIAHRPLYATDRPDAVDVVTLLRAAIEQVTGQPAQIDIDSIFVLPIERAVALALVVHELVGGWDGPISKLRVAGGKKFGNDRLHLELEGSMGTRNDRSVEDGRIVAALSRQLGASISHPRPDLLVLSMPYDDHG